MKLFIVACVKEYQEDVYKIFQQAKMEVFSAADVTGFKNNSSPNLLEEWFAAGDERFDSKIIFSFTSDANAETGIDLVQQYNSEKETDFPVRAFMLPVEKSA